MHHLSLPVIVGTGLSGVAISHALSAAGHSHFLIGSPPNALPKLGESINLEGTIELLRLFPNLSRFYFPKKAADVYLHDKVVACDFETNSQLGWLLRLFGFVAPPELLHVDRSGFDLALYETAVTNPLCIHLDARVESVKYDSESDKITEVVLSNGSKIAPSFVFDATNHVRLIARALKLGITYLSEPQRVVYTHYKMESGISQCEPTVGNWRHSTNLLRLHQESDAIDGFAWAIPLGDTISVGLSMDADDAIPDVSVLAALDAAYARRNVDYRRIYANSTTIRSLEQRYFIHEHAYGRNWLLAGPSFCQIWYMSSSGLGTSLAAARIAPCALTSLRFVGPAYETYMKELVSGHHPLEWFVSTRQNAMTKAAVQMTINTVIRSNLRRMAKYAQLARVSRMGALTAKMFCKLLDLDYVLTDDYCAVTHGPPE